MLTFLRKIRKSLINPGSAQKYVLYAIGEIALVVIGILIALQINNWNEERKERIEENAIMLLLKNSTAMNLIELKVTSKRVSDFIVTCDSVLTVLDRKGKLSTSLISKFPQTLNTGIRIDEKMNMSGYSALESAGLDILRSDQLELAIIDLYETQLPMMESKGREWSEYYREITLELSQRGVISFDKEGYKPKDIYNEDNFDYLRSSISLRRAHKIRGLHHLGESIEKCSTVLDLIESELSR